MKIRFPAKTSETNQEEGQYRSVFELKKCEESHRILSIICSFYLVVLELQYAMDV